MRFTLNLNPRLNFSIAYKGLRSEGNYINQLSTGILDLQQATTQKMSAILPMLILRVRIF
jgi:hypothetical protein